jgi:WD40 repeat protein
MLRKFQNLTFATAGILSLISCQRNPASLPAVTPSPTSLATPAEEGPDITSAQCFTPVDLNPISFTPDSKKLAIRTGSGVQIFNLETMEEEAFAKSSQAIVSAALSPDGKHLAWSLENHSIELIRIANSKVLHTLEGHTEMVFKLRFSSDGNQLFSGSHDHSVRIWDSNGDLLHVIETNGEVLGIGVSADSTRLATIPFEGPVELWDLVRYQKISALGGSGGFDTSDAVFSPDGKYLAADLATGLFLWRLSDGESLWSDPKNSLAVTFSPDGQYLAYANVDTNQVVLSSSDGQQIVRTMEGMQGTVWELFFSPDNSMLAATDGREIRVWQVENGKVLYVGKPSCP